MPKTALNLRVGRRVFALGQRTWIMGIVNVTPDSFSDGGLYLDSETAVSHGLRLVSEGADILDIGGESSRPGSEPVGVELEKKRILPVIRRLRERSSVLISVDTTKAEVAAAALESGADIINDISGLRFDPEMASVVARSGAGFILMHMRGTPKTMQIDPRYEDLIGSIKGFFEDGLLRARSAGIDSERIILDPGIGFGKSFRDNLILMNRLDIFRPLHRPLLVGPSRKAFIGNILNLPASERVEGTIAAGLVSRMHGAHILRVHDVESVKRALDVADAILTERLPHDPVQEGKESNPGHVH